MVLVAGFLTILAAARLSGQVDGLFLVIVAWVCAFFPLWNMLPPLVRFMKTWIAKARGRSRGAAVMPGSHTPGIYAMRRIEDVQADWWTMAKTPAEIVVRGSVWLWGETIEHEWAVKGGFGYPGTIEDVLCARCFGWMSATKYDYRIGPPIHVNCPVSDSWLIRSSMWVVDGVIVRPLRRHWQLSGLSELRATASQWFEEGVPTETLCSVGDLPSGRRESATEGGS